MTVSIRSSRGSLIIETTAILSDPADAQRGTQWLRDGELTIAGERVTLTIPEDSDQLPLAVSIVEGAALAHRERIDRTGSLGTPDEHDLFTIEQIAAAEGLDISELRRFTEEHRFLMPRVRTQFHPSTGAQAISHDDYARLVRGGTRLRSNTPWTVSESDDILAVGIRDDVRVFTAWSAYGGLDPDAPREIITIRADDKIAAHMAKDGTEFFAVPGHRNRHVIVPRRSNADDHFDRITRHLGGIGIDLRFTTLGRQIESGWRDDYPGGSTEELPYREIGGW